MPYSYSYLSNISCTYKVYSVHMNTYIINFITVGRSLLCGHLKSSSKANKVWTTLV